MFTDLGEDFKKLRNVHHFVRWRNFNHQFVDRWLPTTKKWGYNFTKKGEEDPSYPFFMAMWVFPKIGVGPQNGW